MSFAASLCGSLTKSPEPARPAYQNTVVSIVRLGQALAGITRTDGTESNHETSPGDTEGNPTSVIWLGRADVTGDLGIVQTLSSFAGEGDITIAEDVVDKLIHRGLFESTSAIRPTVESGRALDFLVQEIADICS